MPDNNDISTWTRGQLRLFIAEVAGTVSSSGGSSAGLSADYVPGGSTGNFQGQLAEAGSAVGDVLKYGSNSGALTVSTVYYLDPGASTEHQGAWKAADAGSVIPTPVGANQLLGVAVGTSATTDGLLLKGFIRVAAAKIENTPVQGAVDGKPVYLSTTAGKFNFTAPSSSGEIVRVLGYAIDNDSVSADVLVWFNPDPTWVEIS